MRTFALILLTVAPALGAFTVVGACYKAKDCKGEKASNLSVTETYCKTLGGNSIRFSTSCKNL